jgi:predicted DNA-binding transcriptional regulator YafY
LHKMNSSLHKRPSLVSGVSSKATAKSNISPEQVENLAPIDIEKENRLAKIISLLSKGLTQLEIAQEIGVDQSTISRDLQYLKQEAKKKIEKYLNEDILFEYLRYIAGSNEVTRHLWEIVQSPRTATKDKTNALSLLTQSYNKRLELLIGGPESYLKAKKSLSEIKNRENEDRFPLSKMLSDENISSFGSALGKNKRFKI